MKGDKKLKSGQSLLEMVFAIGVMLIVVSAVLALAASNTVGQKEGESQIIANNLAREAIEVVRSIRDANWLAGEKWDEGLTDFSPATVEYNSEVLINPVKKLLYIYNGTYSHDDSVGQFSGFSRYLDLQNICLASSGQESIKLPCSGGEQKIGLQISAVVEWTERDRDRKVTLKDLIYDWK